MTLRPSSRGWRRVRRSTAPIVVLLACAMIALLAGVSRLAADSRRPGLAAASRFEPTTPRARHFAHDPVMEELTQVLTSAGLEAALAHLEVVSATDSDVRERKHPYVHDLGWLAYEHYRDVEEAFRRCPTSPDTGCHHGVVQAYLAWNPEFNRGDINAFCDGGAIDTGPLEILRFQCFHGLGHGLMLAYGNRLGDALAACDLREEERDRATCYGGVFMESIDGFTYAWERSPDITIDPAPPAVSRLAPCDRVVEMYRSACYLQLPMAILPANGYDFAESFATCELAPGAYIVNCYQGMGGMAAVMAFGDPPRAQDLCTGGSSPYRVWCIAGGVWTLISVHGRADEALAYCAASPPEIVSFCFETLGEGIPTVYSDPVDQRAACAEAVQSKWVRSCLHAAGLAT